MDDQQQPDTDREQPRTVPGPRDDSLPAQRMARLRGGLRENRNLQYLLEDPQTPKRTSAPKPWVLITTAATGGVLAVASALIFVVLPGGSGSAAKQASEAPTASPTQQMAVVNHPTVTSTPTAAATIARPTPAAGEGAMTGPLKAPQVPAVGPSFVSPVQVKPQVTDRFGVARGGDLVHSGVDVVSAVASSFDVVAACDGTVAGADHSNTYGDFVVVDCGGSWRTVYAQMTKITARPGQRVRARESVLGQVTGFLHLEVRWNDAPLNPEAYIDFNAPPPSTPTAEPSATATPKAATPTRAPASGGEQPSQPPPPSSEPPTSTPTSAPPTATPTATTPPPTATATPTSTPTPRPSRHEPTPEIQSR